MLDHSTLRPAPTGVLWREQGSDHSAGFRCAEVGARTRLALGRRLPGPLDQEHARKLQSAIAREVVPAPAMFPAESGHALGDARHGKDLRPDSVLPGRTSPIDDGVELARLEVETFALDAENAAATAVNRA